METDVYRGIEFQGCRRSEMGAGASASTLQDVIVLTTCSTSTSTGVCCLLPLIWQIPGFYVRMNIGGGAALSMFSGRNTDGRVESIILLWNLEHSAKFPCSGTPLGG